MAIITDLPFFLASVVLISVPLVVTPGPVFAVTVAKGYGSKAAGALIALGHGAVEFPLIFLLYFGLSEVFANSIVHKVIGLVGGSIMIYIGFQTLRGRKEYGEGHHHVKHSSFVAGLIATAANPYFFISWATVGVALVENAAFFGLMGLLMFAVTHWSCDLLWDTFVSVAVFKSRRFWTRKVFNLVFIFCFVILVSFGLWFIFSALLL
ncbi:MAG: LysE family transporter [Candidatus Bathyarchaeia archaeon]